MSIDQELAQAVADAEAAAPAVTVATAEPPSPSPKKSYGLLLALLAMVGAILVLVFTSFEGSAIYSLDVHQLVKEKDKYAARNVRVQGILVKGSLLRREEPCEYRFRVEKGGEVLNVSYPQCIVPDTFRDMPGMDVEVTAEGKLAASGEFQATKIMAKCPSKYEMKERAKSGESAPHAAGPALEPLSQKE